MAVTTVNIGDSLILSAVKADCRQNDLLHIALVPAA